MRCYVCGKAKQQTEADMEGFRCALCERIGLKDRLDSVQTILSYAEQQIVNSGPNLLKEESDKFYESYAHGDE